MSITNQPHGIYLLRVLNQHLNTIQTLRLKKQ